MKINHNYFALSRKIDVIRSFVKQGNIFSHLIDRIKWHMYPRWGIVSKFPTHIDIEASSACNLLCPMCKSTNMRKAGIKFGDNMEWGLYAKLIDECAGNSIYSVKLSWRGEPLMNPEIGDMVRYAKVAGIKDVAFLSNGVLLNNSVAEILVDGGLDWISISFDGLRDSYEKIRYPAKFDKVFDQIKYMRTYIDATHSKCQIRIQTIQSAVSGDEKEFLDLWEGVADKVYFIPDQMRTLDEDDYKHDFAYVCPNPWQRMVIAADGSVPQCITDYLCHTRLGDTNSQTIKEIWHGDGFNTFRAQIKKGERLNRKPCRLCGTGAMMEDATVKVENRRLKIRRYK